MWESLQTPSWMAQTPSRLHKVNSEGWQVTAASFQQVELMWQRIFRKGRPWARGIVCTSLPTCSLELTLGKPTSGSGGDCRVGAFSVPSCSASASPSFSPHLSHFLSFICHCGWGLRSVREGTIGGQQRWHVHALCPLLTVTSSCRATVLRTWGHESSMGGLLDISQALRTSPAIQPAPPAYLDGVIGVRSFPMVWITLLPQTQSPVQIPTPP